VEEGVVDVEERAFAPTVLTGVPYFTGTFPSAGHKQRQPQRKSLWLLVPPDGTEQRGKFPLRYKSSIKIWDFA
jgi:hypothetical protein